MLSRDRIKRALHILKWIPLLAPLVVISMVLGIRQVGVLEGLELNAYDWLMSSRPKETADPRLLLITIDENDITNQKQWPVSDQAFWQLFKKLNQYKPKAIGLDIFRDIPVNPGHEKLADYLKKTDNIYIICKVRDGNNQTTPPPPTLDINQVGFSDSVPDQGNTMRRSLLFLTPPKDDACSTKLSLGFRLAMRYLSDYKIKPELSKDNFLKIKDQVFIPLHARQGAYRNQKIQGGYQILINYRSTRPVADTLTLTQALTQPIDPVLVKDRIILIGSVAPSLKDNFYTPLSINYPDDPKISGVEIHGHVVSQILSAVLDGRPNIWVWSNWIEVLWIAVWSIVGSAIAYRFRTPIKFGIMLGTGIILIYITAGQLLLIGGWIPLVPPIMTLVITAGSVFVYNLIIEIQIYRELLKKAKEQEENIILMNTFFNPTTPFNATTFLQADSASMAIIPPITSGEEVIRQAHITNLSTNPPELNHDELTESPPDFDDIPELSDKKLKTTLINHKLSTTQHQNHSIKYSEVDKTSVLKKEVPKVDTIASEISARSNFLLGGRYQFLKDLAVGGFGVTYLATDQHRPGHPVCVVKQLKPARTDEKFLEVARRLFITEAEILEKLGHHPCIPELYAYFEEAKEFYLVQEFIEGHSLSQEIISDHKLDQTQVIEILLGILGTLEYIHHYRVIHRDIKPANIIRRKSDNQLVLIDFGAVKQLKPDMMQAESYTIAIGTRGYSPPEQASGHPCLSSDIYAVGMIGIQALTGIMPFRLESDPETGKVIWREECSVSDELAAILDKMIESFFINRYQSAVEVLKDLKRLSK